MSVIQKKGVIALAIAGAMVAIAGCSSSEPKQEDPNIDSVIQQTQTGYRNTSEGYTFTYPQNWQNGIIQRDTLEWNGQRMQNAENMAVFYYKNFELNSEPAPLLALTVYPQQQWEQMQNKATDRRESVTPHVIDTKDDRVLVAYINSQSPFDPDSRQGQEFARHVLTPGQVESAISW